MNIENILLTHILFELVFVSDRVLSVIVIYPLFVRLSIFHNNRGGFLWAHIIS